MGTVFNLDNNGGPKKRGPKGPWKHKHTTGPGAGPTDPAQTGGQETHSQPGGQNNESTLVNPGDPRPVEINFSTPGKDEVPQLKAQKKPSKTKPKTPAITPEHLASLLLMSMDLVASRAGEHWKITTGEAMNVAQPLARILERMNLADKVAKYGDEAALVMAVGAIVAPRVMISAALKKSKGKEAQPTNEQHQQKGPDKVNNGPTPGPPTDPRPAANTGGLKARIQDVIPTVA